MATKDCPCGSGDAYAACCAPFHRGEREAPTPEALMRSRFSAYARGDAEYLWRTLHADHDDRGLDKTEWLRAIRHTSSVYKYMRLRVFEARGSQVLFRAHVFERGKDRSFLELSAFEHDGTGWRYAGGVTRAADDREWTIAAFEEGRPD